MLEEGGFPAFYVVTGLAALVFKLLLMRVLMAVAGVAALRVKGFVFTLYMAFFALCLRVLSFQPVAFVLSSLVFEKRWLPALYVMAGLTFFVFKLSLMWIFMTVAGVAAL